MKKLTELAINRPLLIVVIFVTLILFGIISYNSLNYTLLPKFDAPVVSVITTYRGASAEEIENTVTKEIEDAISSIEGVDKIIASSMEGLSFVVVQLKNGIDVDKAQNDAQRKVNQILIKLPSDVDDPIVNKFSTDDMPVIRMGVTANIDAKELYDIIDLQIKPQLSNIEGVGQVNIIGGNERQLRVNLNKNKLESYGLNVAQVSNYISASSLSTPAGKIENIDREYAIKFDAKVTNAEELRNMVVLQNPNGSKVYLKDVAEIYDGQEDITMINHINGMPSVGIQVLKQTDANAVDVSMYVKAKMQEIKNTYKNLDFNYVIASDQSIYTLKSANAVMFDLVLAIAIVSLVMLMFLHSIRSSLFVLVALPASIIPTFIAMFVFGMTLNLMTLMALSLVVGILVDDSIVILENIMRHMEMGKNKRQATIDGRSEIGFTAISITLVDVVVFLPMALAGGMIGNILREFSLVVVTSTLMSLLVCFTLTPLLASRWGKKVHLSEKTVFGKISLWFERQITGLRNAYTNILRWALRRKRYVFGGVLALFIFTGFLFSQGLIGFSFMSKGDQGEMIVKLELEPTASIIQTNRATQQIEQMFLNEEGVETVFSNIGYSSSSLGSASSSNKSEINVKLVDAKQRSFTTVAFIDKMKIRIEEAIPGIKISASQPDLTGNANESPLQFIVKGNNRDSIRKVAEQIYAITAKTPGVVYPDFSTDDPKPQIDIQLDREKMAIFGLNAIEVGSAIGNNFRGSDQTKYKHEGNEYSIMIQSDNYDKSKIEDVRSLTFVNAQGQTFQLSQFANVNETLGESVLQRMNRMPSITVNGDIQGRSVGVVGEEIIKEIEQLDLPTGVTWTVGGQLEMQGDAFGSLLLALFIGILLVYLIMVALYENAIYPFVVMFSLPLAMIGAFLALALTMNELTIFAMIGLIMLMGLVAKNGILLVDFTNQRKAEGASLVEALIDAGKERFRPIMMTTIAMALGMLPIALATGSGSEVKNGLAWVIIGGLTSSLFLTLLVVPCVYYIVDKILDRFRVKSRRKLKAKVIERQTLISE